VAKGGAGRGEESGPPPFPRAERGPAIRSATGHPPPRTRDRFCLIGLEFLPQFHSLLSVCRSPIVIESPRVGPGEPLRARGSEGGVHEDQAPICERDVVIAHAEDHGTR
jgi:hypothetical protein